MKNKVLVALMFASGSLIMNGCNSEDTLAPVVTLNGQSTMTSSLNSTFTDPGATAQDDNDGTIASSAITVSGTVNKDLAGDYVLTYTATDAAGNSGTATRTVTVKNDADAYAGNYNVTEVCGTGGSTPYSQTITTSTTVNNRVHFNKFGDYLNNSGIYGDIVGTTMTIPSQNATNVGTPPNNGNRTFSGSANNIQSSGFTINYTETTSTGSTTCSATFVK